MSHSSHNILKRPVLIPDNRLHCIMKTKFRFASMYNRKKATQTIETKHRIQKMCQLENVATANALQLEVARRQAVAFPL